MSVTCTPLTLPIGTNAPMAHPNVIRMLKSTSKGLPLPDERGRTMRFPRRQDYVRQLQEHELIVDEAEFISNDRLTEAVYRDWLSRPQVGCVFAQLLSRPVYRTGIRTVVARGSSGIGDPSELAVQISSLVDNSVNYDSDEALSVLLPQILDAEALTRLVWELRKQPQWTIEKERPWRGTLVLIGLRVEIAPSVVAETLGMGPFPIFPTTRQCPITTLEIRTKTTRSKKSHLSNTRLASHLADIPISREFTNAEFGARFRKFTPALRKRILGKQEDMRAKAGITYSLPAAIWSSLKESGS